MTVLSERQRIGDEDVSNVERIRRAALKCFATRGASGTSLREVAEAAGVSIGLVQHHFATKAGLVTAVDEYVLAVVINAVAKPVSAPPRDSIADMGSRVTGLLMEHPDVVDYFGRALIDGSAVGRTIWDTLAAFGTARWNSRRENGEARADIDVTWAAMNSLVLALGTLIVRSHIERQVPGAFSSPAQLARWQESVNTLLRDGLFRHDGETES